MILISGDRCFKRHKVTYRHQHSPRAQLRGLLMST